MLFFFRGESNFSKVFIDKTESFKNTVNLIANQNPPYKYTHMALLEKIETQKRVNIVIYLKAKYTFSSDSYQFRMDSLNG